MMKERIAELFHQVWSVWAEHLVNEPADLAKLGLLSVQSVPPGHTVFMRYTGDGEITEATRAALRHVTKEGGFKVVIIANDNFELMRFVEKE